MVIRFIKGAIHGVIILPVVLHAAFAALVAFIDQNLDRNLGLPTSIVRNAYRYNLMWFNAKVLDPELVHSGWPHAGLAILPPH